MNQSTFRCGTAYFGVRNPALAVHDLRNIAETGHTHILLTWSEEDQWYYRDTMGELINLAISLGLKVYVNPWGVGRVFGGEAFSELAARNPDWAQRAPDGRPLVAACPNHPGFQEWMSGWIQSVCATAVDTVFWDEPHFFFDKKDPGFWACRCKRCQMGFREAFGTEMPQQLTPEVRQFREGILIRFLRQMTDAVHSAGKRNSVCVLPPSFEGGLSDWSRIAALPHVDELATDPYWEKGGESPAAVSATYREASEKVLRIAAAHGLDAQMWIKNYHIPGGKEDIVAVATRSAFLAGIRSIFAWSYRGSAYLSWLRSDDPELVWKAQVAAFADCHRNSH